MKIRRDIVERIRSGGLDEVRRFLQAAIELEHATIPPYLTALYSIKPGTNKEVAQILTSVARQEMLHLCIAANVLNALGGAPQIAHPSFLPVFPGPLPMGIGDLTVGLEKLTRGLVFHTFMAIEQPEAHLELPVKAPRLAALMALRPAPADATDFATIGQFYAALMDQIGGLEGAAFAHASHPQVTAPDFYPTTQLFPVTDAPTAIAALRVIVEQGEGSARSPLDASDAREVAHYYRFAEIVYARRLVLDAGSPNHFSYSGDPVGLDPAGVWNLLPNAKSVDYAPGSAARALSERFNYTYTSLLKALHTTFNGQPKALLPSLGLMFELKILAGSLAATPVEGTDYQAAPTFEYTPLLGAEGAA